MIVLVYGLPGTGKSILLHEMVKVYARTHLLFVKDHALEWGPKASHWRGRPPENLRLVHDIREIQDTPPEELPPTGVFVFQQADAAEVAQLVVDKGDAVYVDDEIDFIARRAGWEDSPLRTVVHKGRHAMNENGWPTEVHLLGACRRPQFLHTDLTEIAQEVYVFRVRGSKTLGRLKSDSQVMWDEDLGRLQLLPTGVCFHVESQSFLRVK